MERMEHGMHGRNTHLLNGPGLFSAPALLQPCYAPVTLTRQNVSLRFGLETTHTTPLEVCPLKSKFRSNASMQREMTGA